MGSAGTTAALDVAKQLMVSGRISSEDATDIFSSLNIHLRVPSDYVLRQLLVGDPYSFLDSFTRTVLDGFQVWFNVLPF